MLGDPRDAQHLVSKLTEELPDSTASTYEVRRYKEVFADAWKGWIRQSLLNLSRPFQALPVIKGGQFLAWSTSSIADSTSVEVAYVLDEVDILKEHLISELEVPTFPFDVDADQASTVLEKVAPGRFSRSSQLQVEVLVDGVLAAPSGATPLLTDVVGDWRGLQCAQQAGRAVTFSDPPSEHWPTFGELLSDCDRKLRSFAFGLAIKSGQFHGHWAAQFC